MMNKIIKRCLILFFILALLTGCADYTELNELAIVVGIGVDWDSKTDQYMVTFQIINPSENSPTNSGGGTSVPFVNTVTKGRTISEAARNASLSLPRTMVYDHTALIVIGEDIARKKGIETLFDAFEREVKVQTNIPVVIAKGQSANMVLSLLPPLDKVPSGNIVKKLVRTSQSLGENPNIRLSQVVNNLLSDGIDNGINGVVLKGPKKIGSSKSNLEKLYNTHDEVNGIGLFRNEHLVGWMTGKQSKSIEILNNQLKSTDVSVFDENGESFACEITYSKAKTKVTYPKSGTPKISIQIYSAGRLHETHTTKLDIKLPDTQLKLNRIVEKEIKSWILNGVHTAQGYKSDVFGFGDMLYKSNPRRWKEVKDNWNEEFSKATVEVNVHFEILDTGIQTNSAHKEKVK